MEPTSSSQPANERMIQDMVVFPSAKERPDEDDEHEHDNEVNQHLLECHIAVSFQNGQGSAQIRS